MSVDIRVSGPKNTTLTFSYVLVTRAFVYQVANQTDFLANCELVGFKTLVFTDGYDKTWRYSNCEEGVHLAPAMKRR